MARPVRLLLADVDGTLVTHDKLLTARAVAAVAAAGRAGIGFAVTSGRPPRGMRMLFEPLDITTPIAGFNGGMMVARDLSVIEARTLDDAQAGEAFEAMRAAGLDVWVYAGNDWFVGAAEAPHVARERWTVQFDPVVTADLAGTLHDVVKLVGVSDDAAVMGAAEAAVAAGFGGRATVARSQPYYLDITHRDANKGAVLDSLSRRLGIDPAEIATIGDQPNDTLMFAHAGISIAMGNAPDAVKRVASRTTEDSEHEGFAVAVERLVAEQVGAR